MYHLLPRDEMNSTLDSPASTVAHPEVRQPDTKRLTASRTRNSRASAASLVSTEVIRSPYEMKNVSDDRSDQSSTSSARGGTGSRRPFGGFGFLSSFGGLTCRAARSGGASAASSVQKTRQPA